MNFAHAGDLGDVIYALPTIRAMGGGTLRLRPGGYTDKPMDEARADQLVPLIARQPYIERVYFDPQPQDLPGEINLDAFRDRLDAGNLVNCHAVAQGVTLPDPHNPEPWLTAACDGSEKADASLIVLNKTARYSNPWFPWRRLTSRYPRAIAFVGTQDEFIHFSRNYYLPLDMPLAMAIHSGNLLELARTINGAGLFVGNQSCPFAIAVGLGKAAILAVCPSWPNTIFSRPNITNYIMGDLHIPEL